MRQKEQKEKEKEKHEKQGKTRKVGNNEWDNSVETTHQGHYTEYNLQRQNIQSNKDEFHNSGMGHF
jgi:hypothetical protein